jgi:hypothetical protein
VFQILYLWGQRSEGTFSDTNRSISKPIAGPGIEVTSVAEMWGYRANVPMLAPNIFSTSGYSPSGNEEERNFFSRQRIMKQISSCMGQYFCLCAYCYALWLLAMLCEVDVGRENVAQSPKSDFHDDANEFPALWFGYRHRRG